MLLSLLSVLQLLFLRFLLGFACAGFTTARSHVAALNHCCRLWVVGGFFFYFCFSHEPPLANRRQARFLLLLLLLLLSFSATSTRVRDLGAQETVQRKRRPITKSYLRSFVQLICYGFDKGGAREREREWLRWSTWAMTAISIGCILCAVSTKSNKLTHISVQHVARFVRIPCGKPQLEIKSIKCCYYA